jgi:hypothetical protein
MKIPYLACRRFYAGLIAFILFAGVLTGCGGSAESSRVKREIPAPDEVSEEPQEAEAARTPALDQTKEEQIAGAQKPTGDEKYKAASGLMTEISEKINEMRDGAIDVNNREHAESDPQYIAGAMPILLYFVSPAIICSTGFSEDETANNGIAEAAGYVGITDAKAVRNGMYEYTLTGHRFSDGQACEVHCLCGLLKSFIYTRAIDSARYSSETDSIYPVGGQSGFDWAEASSNGGRDEYVAFDGKTVKMEIKPFFGEAISAEVTVPKAGF